MPTCLPLYEGGRTSLLNSEARGSLTPHRGPRRPPGPCALRRGSCRRPARPRGVPGASPTPSPGGRSPALPPRAPQLRAPRRPAARRRVTSMASRCRLRGGRARCPLGSPRPPGRGCGAQGRGAAAARRRPRSGLRAARPCASSRGRGRPGEGEGVGSGGGRPAIRV